LEALLGKDKMLGIKGLDIHQIKFYTKLVKIVIIFLITIMILMN